MKLSYENIRNSHEVNTYIRQADQSLAALGYTEHSFTHAYRCVGVAALILSRLGYGERQVELARIAAYMHDIGNVINRIDHAQSGAMMAFRILDHLGAEPEEIATVVTAIGNHDEHTAYPVNAVAAALILADKTDVRKTRVRSRAEISLDIHDRVNFAVQRSTVGIDTREKLFTLDLVIDTKICPVMAYFEIFLQRMLLCRKAAEFFGLRFRLQINGQTLL